MRHSVFQVFLAALVAGFFVVNTLWYTSDGTFSGRTLDYVWQKSGQFVTQQTALESQVVIIGVDDPTLNRWRTSGSRLDRRLYANLIDRLASMGARLIGFDITFDEPSSPEADEALLMAAKRFGKVVTNCYYQGEPSGTNLSIVGRAIFKAVVLSEGYANFPYDLDKYVRRIRFYLPQDDLPIKVPFSLALYLACIDSSADKIDSCTDFLRIPSMPGVSPLLLSLDHKYQSLIGFSGGPGTLPTFSAADLIDGKIEPEKIQDKVVLVGGTAKELHDSFITPFSPRGDLPGVEIHGQQLNALFAGFSLREISGPYWSANLALAGAILAALGVAIGLMMTLLIGIILGALGYIATFFLFTKGVFFNFSDWWIALTISWFIAAMLDGFYQQWEKKTITGLFRQYVSPHLLEELLAHPEKIALGGARKEAVVMFADIRGFTGLCEDLEPEQVIAMLNIYFHEVTKVIVEHGGILDKYIGDGLMAFFGVPIARTNETEMAVQAALGMQAALARLRAQGNTGADFPIDRIGIAIHGGDVLVGNVGSQLHRQYTLLGDTVNIAARLESMAREGEILISGWVAQKLPPTKFRLLPRGTVPIRGRKGEIEIFEVRNNIGVSTVPARALPGIAKTPSPKSP